jgi:hypothetical protein
MGYREKSKSQTSVSMNAETTGLSPHGQRAEEIELGYDIFTAVKI